MFPNANVFRATLRASDGYNFEYRYRTRFSRYHTEIIKHDIFFLISRILITQRTQDTTDTLSIYDLFSPRKSNRRIENRYKKKIN